MKQLLSILFICLFSFSSSAGNLKAYFTYCTFNSPADGPYIETYLNVIGGSAIYGKTAQNTFQGEIEITYIFKQGEEIIKFKKYNLLSPEISDSLSERVNFMDQQRIPLPNGNYQFDISIRDINSNDPPFNSTQKLIVDYPANKVSISDVQLIESTKKATNTSILTKSGLDIIPYTSDFYSEEFEKIAFYSELYNIDKKIGENEDYLISYFIESYEGQLVVGNYKSFNREKAKPVSSILKTFNIKELPSGNYNLVIEARDKSNNLIINKKVFFQRSNPSVSPILMTDDFQKTFVSKLSKSELIEHIKSIEPIATNVEKDFAENQLNSDDEELMRQFFYNFWFSRNETDPEGEWNKYYKEVKKVNELFSTVITKGYSTDRGRLFLKYGKPNTRSVFPSEPSAYPYEIWHYHKIENFSNKRFVFYSRDLSTNEYPLIHSTMPGYINNPQWKIQVYKRTNQPADLENGNNRQHYGGRADDYFNNPR
ncbi:MAG: GWxTD domain-containing protein [Vicingaceae bacterium]